MIGNLVTIYVFCSKTPYTLTMLSFDGRLKKQMTIKSKCTKICIPNVVCGIKLLAKNENHTIFKKICFSKQFGQTYFLNLAFSKIVSKNLFCAISLCDANYGFPVKSAMLRFWQKV